MQKFKVPGAVITIITDSSEVFTRGYGYADVENQIAVDPKSTLFRIASITKTFTATAAMQLVEQGTLDLHTDIGNYLPDKDFDFLKGEPFTMHHLLTHTAGFDLTDTGDAALTPEEVVPLEQLARRQMPDQVHKPGTVFSYSNFGYALAGYVIQTISGMSYEDYMIRNVLNPIGMNQTGIRQPLPKALKLNLANSYTWEDGQVALERDYTNTLPGGGIISNAVDMSRYMKMHLQGGIIDSTVILNAENHRILTSQKYGSKNTKYGICYAFNENMWNGRRSIDHSGGQLGFLSLMVLIPKTGTGIFIAHNNRQDASGFRYNLTATILDTLIGQEEREIQPLTPSKAFDNIADNYTGRYLQMNYPHNTFEKVSQLFGFFANEHQVSHDSIGSLTIFGSPFVQIEDHLFQMDRPQSDYKVEFLVDDNGLAYQLFAGTNSYQRIPWYQHNRLKQIGMIFSILVMLIFVLSRPAISIIRKIRNRKIQRKRSWLYHWQYWTATLFMLGALSLVALFLIYQDQISDYGVPFSLKTTLGINTIGALSAVISPMALWSIWKSNDHSKGRKFLNTLVIISIIITTIILVDMRMIGFQYY
ncbi:MAG: beta-lactamase family protein [Bacteroidia bacterium]|nr:beta-lactamase family protein [Bacteroidia bacterium]